jgi:hypothetical protein
MISTYARAFLVTATCSSSVDLQKTREKSERDNPKVLADSSISLMISCFLLTLLRERPRKTGSRLPGGEVLKKYPLGTGKEYSRSELFRTSPKAHKLVKIECVK